MNMKTGILVNAIDYSDGAWSVNSRRNALFPNVQVHFLELVQILELALQFPRHEQVLCLFVHSEHVVVLIVELFQFYLVEAQCGQPPKIRIGGHQLSAPRIAEEPLLRCVF